MQTAGPELLLAGGGAEEVSGQRPDQRPQGTSGRMTLPDAPQTDHLLDAKIASDQQPSEIPEVIVPLREHPERDDDVRDRQNPHQDCAAPAPSKRIERMPP